MWYFSFFVSEFASLRFGFNVEFFSALEIYWSDDVAMLNDAQIQYGTFKILDKRKRSVLLVDFLRSTKRKIKKKKRKKIPKRKKKHCTII